MKLAALQPGYLPWLGFFEQVHHVDLFVVYDEVAYSSKSWRNRNRIKTPEGAVYLTVPVLARGPDFPLLKDVKIDTNQPWRRSHYGAISHNYARAEFFSRYHPFIKDLYEKEWESLVDLDMALIRFFAEELGIRTRVVLSSETGVEEAFRKSGKGSKKIDRAIFACKFFGADEFYNGKAGESLYSREEMEREGIRLTIQEFHHPVYRQLFGGFIPYLSVLDLLLNHGPESLSILSGKSAESVA